MNKILLLFVLLFGINTGIYAQNKPTDEIEISEKNISKKWVFKDLINPKLSKEEYEVTKSLMERSSLEFKLDKTYTFSFIVDLTGTWSLDLKTAKITTIDRRGTNTWTIHSLKENEITLSRNDVVQKIVFQEE